MSECIDSGLLCESLIENKRGLNINPCKVTAHKCHFAIMNVNSIARKVVKEFIAFCFAELSPFVYHDELKAQKIRFDII